MTKYVARLNGQIVGNRTTERVYTHAVVVRGHGQNDSVATWCGRLDLAQGEQRKAASRGFHAEIVPAEMVAPNKSPMKQITWSDDTWNVAGRGAERDGKVYLHLSSTTRVQRDGRCPVQICDWVPAELIA
jgi:hypothetical protein